MQGARDVNATPLLVEYLTSGRDGDPRPSVCIYLAGATAKEKRGIRQQAAMFVLREVLPSNRYGE